MTKAPNASHGGQPSAAADAVRHLAVAWRLSSVYDLDHPRVSGALATAVERLLALRASADCCILHVRGSDLCLGAEALPSEPTLDWLRQRFERSGIRALELLPAAAGEHLRELLQQSCHGKRDDPRRLAERWSPDHPGVRLLPMVFDGSFGGEASAPTVPDMLASMGYSGDTSAKRPGEKGGQVLPEHIGSALSNMLSDTEVAERLRTIEQLAATDADLGSSRINVLQHIGGLLPADVSRDPAAIEKVVKKILGQIERDLQELVRTGATVRGGNLMRQALTVAKRFFKTSDAPARPNDKLPTGRPEDEAITADVGLLLAEMAKLPPTAFVQLPPANVLAADAKGPARELFGIALHTLWNGQTGRRLEVLPPLLRTLLAKHNDELADIVARYLSQQGRGHDGHRRVLLQCLVEAGEETAAMARHYLDADLLATGFPELLPLFCLALGNDEEGRSILRDGLQRVLPLLPLGARTACERSGVLRETTVLRALLQVGGPVVEELLPLATQQADEPGRELLVAYLQQQPLPAPEAAVLRHGLANLPAGYLERVVDAWLARRPFESLRSHTCAALRQYVERQQNIGDPVALLRAIDDLQLANDDETIALLKRLQKAGRFTRFDSWSRSIRNRAASVCKRLLQRTS